MSSAAVATNRSPMRASSPRTVRTIRYKRMRFVPRPHRGHDCSPRRNGRPPGPHRLSCDRRSGAILVFARPQSGEATRGPTVVPGRRWRSLLRKEAAEMGLLPSWLTVQIVFAPDAGAVLQGLCVRSRSKPRSAAPDLPTVLRPVTQHLRRIRRAGLRYLRGRCCRSRSASRRHSNPPGLDQREHKGRRVEGR